MVSEVKAIRKKQWDGDKKNNNNNNYNNKKRKTKNGRRFKQ